MPLAVVGGLTQTRIEVFAMTANLMEAVSGLVTPDLVQKAAGASGESAEGTRASLLGAVPTLFAGLASTASSPAGAAGVFGLVTRAATKPKELGGQGLLTSIFGGHSEQVTDALASTAGVRRSSAGGMLALVGPLVLGVLGKEVMSRGLSAGGLTDLLFSHKKAILDDPHLPKGLGEALGVGNLSELGGPAAAVCGPTVSAVESARTPRPTPEEPAKGEVVRERVREPAAKVQPQSRWPIMLLPALLLGVLALWGLSNMFRGRPHVPDVNESPTMRQPGVPERQVPAPTEPQMTEPPRASAVNAPEMPERGSAAPEAALPATNLHFDAASTRLTPDSKDSVDALVSYLDENPTARIRIEGFADTMGEPSSNEALSSSRAQALKSVLTSRGISGSRIDTTGMGQDHPVAPNDTDTDRAQNRRAEVTLIH
jgi:outer membrane protein OmpA-like peptidoglycan-associated protein